MNMDEPFEEGEEVLVESISGKILWSAKILAVARDPEKNEVTGYRLHYTDWSTRFDEWVEPFRVVEPNDNNLTVQEDLLDDLLRAKEALPDALRSLVSAKHLHDENRARGPHRVVPDLTAVVAASPSTVSPSAASLAPLRAALLSIEAALPLGSVDPANWSPDVSARWRAEVEAADDPPTLAGKAVLLESVVSEKWIRPSSQRALSCLPRHWKAVSEASASSLSLRIRLLDGGILYDKVEETRPTPKRTYKRRKS